jgi:hypothetical protein
MAKFDIDVQLSGRDGNAFAILGAVQKALRNAGAPAADIQAFMTTAQSGDYNNLLRTCAEYVNVQ